jgi:hypothetical protein
MMRDPRGFYGQYPAVLNVSYVRPAIQQLAGGFVSTGR